MSWKEHSESPANVIDRWEGRLFQVVDRTTELKARRWSLKCAQWEQQRVHLQQQNEEFGGQRIYLCRWGNKAPASSRRRASAIIMTSSNADQDCNAMECNLFIQSFIHLIIHSFHHSFILSFIHFIIQTIINSFIQSFNHIIIHSFIQKTYIAPP